MSTSDEESWGARFAERYRPLVPPSADRDFADTLELEAATVIESIVDASTAGSLPDPQAPEFRESLTLASLLGRRAALLDATPMAALALAPAIVHSLRGRLDIEPLHEALRLATVDGYVRGREERALLVGARRAADAIPAVKLAPRCFAIFLRGVQAPEEMERVIGDLGRALLAGDARACVVDASGLREPDRERAAQLFSVHETCVMLGVRCIYTGVSAAFIDVAEERGIDLGDVRFVENLQVALVEALDACGLEVRPPNAIKRALGQLFRA